MLIYFTPDDRDWVERAIEGAHRERQRGRKSGCDSDSPLTVEAILAYWKWLDGEREREREKEKENGNA